MVCFDLRETNVVSSCLFYFIYNVVHTRLEEITKKLKSGDVLPLDRERYVLRS